MAKLTVALPALSCCLAATPLAAGFRSPESLVRNVHAFYGDGSPGFSGGLPRDPRTARQFFAAPLQSGWTSAKLPYDFLIPSTSWKLGAIAVATTRRQFDKT